MNDFEKILSGGDLRSIGNSNAVIPAIQNQDDFDELFKYLFHKDRRVVMRAADAIEKITTTYPQYLLKHKKEIFELSSVAKNKELKWHLALLLPRLHLESKEFINSRDILTNWALDKTNSRIVRVNSIQGLFEMMKQQSGLEKKFSSMLLEIEKENIPSVNARIKKLQNARHH